MAAAHAGAVVWPALAVAVAGVLVLPLVEAGPLTRQMVGHLAVMNVAAPLLALAPLPSIPVSLWAAAGAQIALLWAFHLPPVAAAGIEPVMQGLLGLAALAFWQAVAAASGRGRWSVLAVLLLTGKLTCVLGAVLVLAPRDLYGLGLCGPGALADQHLAGLLMITACPLSYLVAGVIVAARALAALETAPG